MLFHHTTNEIKRFDECSEKCFKDHITKEVLNVLDVRATWSSAIIRSLEMDHGLKVSTGVQINTHFCGLDGCQ